MKNFDLIDSTSLKAFYYAAQTGNFTRAQSLANLTQSGISQHVMKLEESLGLLLFDRSEKKLRLTETGVQLFEFAKNYHESLNSLFEQFELDTKNLKGEVSYAMPASCLKTPHFPMLLKAQKDFKEVKLKVTIRSNTEIYEDLMNDHIHFGFMTKIIAQSKLLYQKFAQEDYLCVGNLSLIKTLREKNFVEAPFISYPGMETLFDFWRAHHLPKLKNLSLKSLKIVGEINDLDGAITMCRLGLGLGIFPLHCVSEELKKSSLQIFQIKSTHPREEILIVHKGDRILPARALRVLQEFWKMKN